MVVVVTRRVVRRLCEYFHANRSSSSSRRRRVLHPLLVRRAWSPTVGARGAAWHYWQQEEAPTLEAPTLEAPTPPRLLVPPADRRQHLRILKMQAASSVLGDIVSAASRGETSPITLVAFDGAYHPNAQGLKAGGLGVVYVNSEGNTVERHSIYVPPSSKLSHNVVEYRAAEYALEVAQRAGLKNFTLKGDSQLVLKQLTDEYKVKAPHLLKINRHCKKLVQAMAVTIKWVPRTDNVAADQASQVAISRKASLITQPFRVVLAQEVQPPTSSVRGMPVSNPAPLKPGCSKQMLTESRRSSSTASCTTTTATLENASPNPHKKAKVEVALSTANDGIKAGNSLESQLAAINERYQPRIEDLERQLASLRRARAMEIAEVIHISRQRERSSLS